MQPNVCEENLTMLTDFYELTMGNGYFLNGFSKKQTYFDIFFRKVPDNGGFAIAGGLSDIIRYVRNLHFSGADIAYLRGKGTMAILLVEQYLDFCRELADYVYIMDRGEIVHEGLAETLDTAEARRHLTV